MGTTLLLANIALLLTSCSAVGSKCYGSPPQCVNNKFYYHADRNRCEVVSSEGASCSLFTRAPSTNVFDTLAECMTACVHDATAPPPTTEAPVAIPDLCYLPLIKWASGHNMRWFFYYQRSDRSCHSFVYTGQDDEGNGNRFSTLSECIDTCVNPKSPTPSPSLLPAPSSTATLATPTTDTLTTPTTDTLTTPTTDTLTTPTTAAAAATDRTSGPTLSSAPPTIPRPSVMTDSVKAVLFRGLHPLLTVAIVFGTLVSILAVVGLTMLTVVWIVRARRPLQIRDLRKKGGIPKMRKLSQNWPHITINPNTSITASLTPSSSSCT